MNEFLSILDGGDLRSIGASNTVVKKIKTQEDFDKLFNCLFHSDRLVVMRAADAIEKISLHYPDYLWQHSKEIFKLAEGKPEKELKWHLAQLLPRLRLNKLEIKKAWRLLQLWARDSSNSRIVRVNAIQALFELTLFDQKLTKGLQTLFVELGKESIPSIDARIRKIQKQQQNR